MKEPNMSACFTVMPSDRATQLLHRLESGKSEEKQQARLELDAKIAELLRAVVGQRLGDLVRQRVGTSELCSELMNSFFRRIVRGYIGLSDGDALRAIFFEMIRNAIISGRNHHGPNGGAGSLEIPASFGIPSVDEERLAGTNGDVRSHAISAGATAGSFNSGVNWSNFSGESLFKDKCLIELVSSGPNQNDYAVAEEVYNRLREELNGNPKFGVVFDRVLAGFSDAEIAREIGKTVARVSQFMKQIRNKINSIGIAADLSSSWPDDTQLTNKQLDLLEKDWNIPAKNPPPFTYLRKFLDSTMAEPARGVLLKSLVSVDLELRRKHGFDPKPTNYLDVFPVEKATVEECFKACVVPPAMIAGYAVNGLLGHGGFGEVYRGVSTLTNQTVAIKLVSTARAGDQEHLANLLSEAKRAITLDHPNIVKVLTVVSDDIVPLAIIMEYAEGGSLQSCFESGEAIGFIDSARLVRCLARALEHAHSDGNGRAGLIHRDVKPANILLCPIDRLQDQSEKNRARIGNRWYRPLLSDFGCSVTEAIQTRQGIMEAGSLHYMSPEQTQGKTHLLRSSSDVWSLGVIFYRLLTGKLPFNGDTEKEVVDEIQSRDPRSPREINANVPQRLEELCLGSPGNVAGCLQKLPENRMTPRALADELDQWLARLPKEISGIGVTAAGCKPQNPYLGLEPFLINNREIFFGRKEMVDHLLDRVNTVPLLAIMGASGNGKSSLVQAGFLPKMVDRGWMVFPSVRFYRDPYHFLAEALADLLGENAKDLATSYANDVRKFRDDLKKIHSVTGSRGVILYIDQFEELLTLSNKDLQVKFLNFLLEPFDCNDDWVKDKFKLIITFRSEFLDAALGCHRTSLPCLLEKYQPQPLGPLQDVRNVIECPANLRSVSVEPRLVERIIADVGSEPGNLPLLQYCLYRLWEVQNPGLGDELKMTAYDKIGGFNGAITRHADAVLSSLEREGLADVTRGLLLQLVKVNPDNPARDSRQPRTISYLSTVAGLGGKEGLSKPLEELTKTGTRLLVRDGEGVEIAHESLIREWKTLSTWIVEKREFLLKCDRIEAFHRHNEIIPDGLLSEVSVWLSGPNQYQMSLNCRQYVEQSLALRGRSDARKLFDARLELVPQIVEAINFPDQTRDYLNSLLVNGIDSTGTTLSPSQAGRARFAMLLLGCENHADEVFEDMLAANPEEFAVLRRTLVPYSKRFVKLLWQRISSREKLLGYRIRAACALALFDADSLQWSEYGSDVASLLVQESPTVVLPWAEFLKPVRQWLIPVLKDAFHLRPGFDDASRVVSICLLPGYLTPVELAELALDAQPDQLDALFDTLESHQTLAIKRFKRCLESPIEPHHRKAVAAVGLLRMGDTEEVWPFFDRSAWPDLRTGLIHSAGPARVNPCIFLDALFSKTILPGRRAAAMQALGEYSPSSLPTKMLKDLPVRLSKVITTEQDPEVRASASWLARVWQLPSIPVPAPLSCGRHKGRTTWWASPSGIIMTVLHGPFVVPMGSPPCENGRENHELRHDRQLPRSYAIADNLVTVQQFVAFLADRLDFLVDRKLVDDDDINKYRGLCNLKPGAAELNHPVTNVSWFTAVDFCNWLSRKEGLAEHELVYPQAESWNGRIVKMPAGRLSQPGYRLPTEAEWEYACRSGTATSRFFGGSCAWLGKYAWYLDNSRKSTSEVGMLKPNPMGLFDLYGNVLEWSHNEHVYYNEMNKNQLLSDMDKAATVKQKVKRVLKGGAFSVFDDWCRTAYRHFYSAEMALKTAGLRVAKTWITEPEAEA